MSLIAQSALAMNNSCCLECKQPMLFKSENFYVPCSNLGKEHAFHLSCLAKKLTITDNCKCPVCDKMITMNQRIEIAQIQQARGKELKLLGNLEREIVQTSLSEKKLQDAKNEIAQAKKENRELQERFMFLTRILAEAIKEKAHIAPVQIISVSEKKKIDD